MVAVGHSIDIGADGDQQDDEQCSQSGGEGDFEVGAELILHLAALGRAGGDGGVGNEGEVVAEHSAAHHGGNAQRQGEAGIGSHGNSDGRNEGDGTYGSTHRHRDEAGYYEENCHSQLGGGNVQQEVGGSLGAGATGDAHEDTGSHENKDHGHDVGVAHTLCHQHQLIVKADGAVLQAGHQYGNEKCHHDGDIVKAHGDAESILKNKAEAEIQDQKDQNGDQGYGLGSRFVFHWSVPLFR